MAEETGTNGGTPPEGAQDAIGALFGQNAPQGAPEGGTPPEGQQEAPESYVAGRVPKAFYREDGKHDIDGLSKSWFDTRSAYQSAQARIKELESAAAEGAPEAWEGYSQKLDWDAVAKRAPNAYLGGGADNQAAMALLKRAHEQGMSLNKAQAFVEAYYEDLNGLVPERQSDEDRLKAAVGSLGPNGPVIAQEVRTWLESEHSQRAFTQDQLVVLKQMTHDGTAMSLLQRLMRQGGSAPPPNALPGSAGTTADPKARKAEIERELGELSDAEFSRRMPELRAEWEALNA